MNIFALSRITIVATLVSVAAAHAADSSVASNWPSLASDRVARNVGDILTVVVYENSNATDSAENTVDKNTSLQGSLSTGNPSSRGFAQSANVGLAHTSDNAGTTTRAGTMVGQISVTVDDVFPDGDLHVSGVQTIKVNGEQTRIAVKGRVRQADISASNVILSTSLADAAIEYDGAGLVSDSSKAGILTRVLNWVGLP